MVLLLYIHHTIMHVLTHDRQLLHCVVHIIYILYMYMYFVAMFYCSTGSNSPSQEVDLVQKRGAAMQLVASTMVSSSLNCWLLEE